MSSIVAPRAAASNRSGAATSPPSSAGPWVCGPARDIVFLGGALGLLSAGVLGLYWLDQRFWINKQFWGHSFSDAAALVYSFLFGFPHLAATYCRVYLDRREILAYRRAALLAPVLILLAVVGLIRVPGTLPLLTAVWFHWQWWHIVRQQYGVVRVYQRKQRTSRPELDRRIDLAVIYLIPAWGLLNRSHQWWHATRAGEEFTFLGSPLWMLPTPRFLVGAAAILSLAVLVVFLARQVQLIRAGEFSSAKALILLSGTATFAVALVAIRDINWGYLALSLVHSVQYIFFVWYFQSRKYRSGIDPQARLASFLAQPGNLWAYLLFLGAATLLLRGLVMESLRGIGRFDLLFALVLTFNFHHYLIDTVVWKTRKASA